MKPRPSSTPYSAGRGGDGQDPPPRLRHLAAHLRDDPAARRRPPARTPRSTATASATTGPNSVVPSHASPPKVTAPPASAPAAKVTIPPARALERLHHREPARRPRPGQPGQQRDDDERLPHRATAGTIAPCARSSCTRGGLLVALAADTQAEAKAEFLADYPFSHGRVADPIVFPGKRQGGHSHDFFGNRSTRGESTSRSLRRHRQDHVHPKADRSAYWVPTMFEKGRARQARAGDDLLHGGPAARR